MYNVYVIHSETTGSFYKGLSINIDERIKQHNKGKVKSTKSGRPWKLVYFEKVNFLKEAREREKYLKSGGGRLFLQKILNNTK